MYLCCFSIENVSTVVKQIVVLFVLGDVFLSLLIGLWSNKEMEEDVCDSTEGPLL